ncbi:histone-lysine N-methyltransferase pr-set7-like [Anoplophora glabripennis]|uniref:histone-lysine N-methyltransferase pr-set7-like n=1 Tax=Anoplophora glabripennis TaxID=217634 RepID=UPI0008755FB2|nr:histone-lysine N-methyltransferase pr-set7-like [Anoplophora glabripennis]
MVRVTAAMPTTPIMQTRRQKMTCPDIRSPPTPHRIELRNDSLEEGNCKKPLVQSYQPAPKARRRLNNNQLISQPEGKNADRGSHKLTEYFPVRRSARKTKKTVLEERQRDLEQALRNKVEEGLEVRYFDGKGRGVVAAKDFSRGDFVVEYSGDLIDTIEAKVREERYAQDQNAGCYMYYFKYNGQQYCIDATAESVRLGRLVNHSRNGNLLTRTISVDGKPRLVLIAKDDIKMGEEILYDYGDRSKESLKHHPWLAY